MKLTIVYDNEVYKKGCGLQSDWGFSCLIEDETQSILFDTGAKGEILLNNMKKLNIDPDTITTIVISHEHWDHNGGLSALSSLAHNVKLFRFSQKKPSDTMHLVSSEKMGEIADKIVTTGRLKGSPVDEQSLVLKGDNGWYVLAGCSHPGVKAILDVAGQQGIIVGLIGGLHGFNNFNILEGLDLICPCHCTKHKQQIKSLFPSLSVEGGVGRTIEI